MQARMKPGDERELRVTRVFDAPRELVFRLWTQAEHFARWCAPARFEIVDNGLDLRRGGVWWSLMRNPEGEECRASGVYREIVANERLVFTYAHDTPDGRRGPETLVTVAFEARGAQTKLTLHQAVFETVTDCSAHVTGWSDCLDRLAAYLPEVASFHRQ